MIQKEGNTNYGLNRSKTNPSEQSKKQRTGKIIAIIRRSVMKHILIIITCLLLVVITFPSTVQAEEIDLSSMTFDELIALKDRINLAIWECNEWQEVTVPQGIWVVGQDIPEGTWTIRCANNDLNGYTAINASPLLDGSGEVAWTENRYIKSGLIASVDYYDKRPGQQQPPLTEFTATLIAGDYVQISFNDAVFTPYTGKPDLGFK